MISSFSIGPLKRVVLAGGGALLLDLIKVCKGSGLEFSVLTSPRHANEMIAGDTFEAAAKKLGVPYLAAASLQDAEVKKFVGPMSDGLALSLGGAWIFNRQAIEELFQGKLVNCHGTRLPQDKGGGGFSWQIMRGNRLGVCLVHKIDEGIDTGDILAYEEFIFPAHCRLPKDYQAVYLEKTLAFLRTLLLGAVKEKKNYPLGAQPAYLSSYFPRLHTPTHSWINWSWPAQSLDRFICAFDDPYEGARTRWKGQEVRLRNVFSQTNEFPVHPFQCGLVMRNNGRWLVVACEGGELIVERVEDAKGTSLLSSIKEGDRLYTLPEDELCSKKRVFYTPQGLKEEPV